MIYNVPLSADFFRTLARFILDEYQHDPVAMAQLMVILPTRRACRFLKEAFLQTSGKRSFLVPQLKSLYDIEAPETSPCEPLSNLKRTLLLAKEFLKFPEMTTSDKAIKMAVSLGEVLDEMYQFETSLDKLEDLVPQDRFAQHWNETVRFLDVIKETWPALLKEKKLIDEKQYQILSINAFTQKLDQTKYNKIIMAGFDGSLPCVIRLADKLHKTNKGDLFFYGLDDIHFEDTTLSACHYQFNLAKIVQGLHLKKKEIIQLGDRNQTREDLFKKAFCMPSETNLWKNEKTDFTPELKQVHSLVCQNLQEEALSIALILREVLETPEKTAVVITNNRSLSERICQEMKRWGINLDDSAGIGFNQTQSGLFFKLVLNAAQENLSEPSLLALLKHPFCKVNTNPEEVLQKEFLLRTKGKKFEHPILNILSSFALLFQNNSLISFQKILKEHIKTVEELTQNDHQTATEILWDFQEAESIWQTLSVLLEETEDIGVIEPKSYGDIFDLFISSIKIRPPYGTHPRLEILGAIEARLTRSDVCIIADLNEGVFPQLPETGPWLNKAMRQKLNLPPLEQKIGIAAFDFAQHFMSNEVYLTRSLKADGTPTVPSRFLLRLEAFLETQDISWIGQRPALPSLLDQPTTTQQIMPAQFTPPLAVRPNKLSVTKIEEWIKDPYSIYARYILKLNAIPSLEESQKQKEYGIALHEALAQCLEHHPEGVDLNTLYKRGEKLLRQENWSSADLAYYLPRWYKICQFVCQTQKERSDFTKDIFAEETAAITLHLEKGDFTLTGKADRIDLLADKTAEIIDYKTGQVPSQKDVKNGFSPQLVLEALLLKEGGFKNISKNTPVSNLSYWKLSGKEDSNATTSVLSNTEEINQQVADTFSNLVKLIERYQCEETPYVACPIPKRAPKYNDYEHLERLKEWHSLEDEEEADE